MNYLFHWEISLCGSPQSNLSIAIMSLSRSQNNVFCVCYAWMLLNSFAADIYGGWMDTSINQAKQARQALGSHNILHSWWLFVFCRILQNLLLVVRCCYNVNMGNVCWLINTFQQQNQDHILLFLFSDCYSIAKLSIKSYNCILVAIVVVVVFQWTNPNLPSVAMWQHLILSMLR